MTAQGHQEPFRMSVLPGPRGRDRMPERCVSDYQYGRIRAGRPENRRNSMRVTLPEFMPINVEIVRLDTSAFLLFCCCAAEHSKHLSAILVFPISWCERCRSGVGPLGCIFAANNSENSGGALFSRWAPPHAVALN